MDLAELAQELEGAPSEPPDLNLDALKGALEAGWEIVGLRSGEGPVSGAPGVAFVLKREQVTSEVLVSSGPRLAAFLRDRQGDLGDVRLYTGRLPKGVELTEVIPPDELKRIVTGLSRATGLACGIVRHPPAPRQGVPQDEVRFAEWRLTPVTSCTEFCHIIRSCSEGNVRCMWSDLGDAERGFAAGRAVVYLCHCQLWDVVAPIRLAGQHAANIYVGQACPPEAQFSDIADYHSALLAASQRGRELTDKKRLEAAFERLPRRSQAEMDAVAEAATLVAALTSQAATMQLTLRRLADARRQIGATLNVQFGLEVLLDSVMGLVGADTGGVFLLQDNDSRLVSAALRWGALYRRVELDVWGPGVVANAVAGPEKMVLCSTRDEIESAVGPPQTPDSRDYRGLQSVIAVPIRQNGHVLGVLEIGSSRRHAFDQPCVAAVQAYGEELAGYLRVSRGRSELVELFGERDVEQLARKLVNKIPLLVLGEACSIFLCPEGSDDARLVATTEFPAEAIGELSYSPWEGLTGWVLATGEVMNIAAGPDCRQRDLAARYPGARWVGKYRPSVTEGGPDYFDYYKDRPWLGVPVRGSGGQVMGVIRISDRDQGSFTEDDENMVQSCADCVARILGGKVGGPT
jgi:ligand-binding sensor protein/GAF domain-containing protein